MREIWKDVIGFEGKYQISNFGRIKSLNYNNTHKEKIMKLSLDKYGYTKLSIAKNNKDYSKTIHRLVAQAFIPNPENKSQINHKNGVKTDNRVENLEWCTVSENHKHAFKNKLRENRKGEDCNFTKLTKEQVNEIRKRFKYEKITKRQLAKEYIVTESNICCIINNKSWKQ